MSAESFVGTSSPRAGLSYVVHSTATITVRVQGSYSSVPADGQSVGISWNIASGNKRIDYQDGVDPGLTDTALSANSLEIADTDSLDFDLYDLTGVDIGHGEGLDQLGTPHQLSRIYAMSIRNGKTDEGSVGDLVVGAATSNPWSSAISSAGEITLPPDSVFILFGESTNGMAVSSSNCNLKLAASGGDVVAGLNYCGCSN